MFGKVKLDEGAQKKFHEGLSFVEGILSKSPYAAGFHLTVADLALLATTSTIDVSHCKFEKKKVSSHSTTRPLNRLWIRIFWTLIRPSRPGSINVGMRLIAMKN